ncbi:MAG: ABC transporter permease [Treponema sp.]|nr:ABC transporter permease [Treponema sp.]
MTNRQSPQLKLASKAYSAKHKKSNPGPGYAWPMGIWFSLFFIVPLIIIVSYSFMKRDIYGGVLKQFSLDAYKQMFSKTYGLIFIRTLWITFVSTLITILIALPCGYAMARSRHQTMLLILVIVPFLTNSLIRIFAWMTILGDNGILNSILEKISYFWNTIICRNPKAFSPHKFMYTNFAVILVSIYMYLPYAILPIFTAVDRFDFTLIEASRDLGATKPQSMIKILIPGVKSGIVSAIIFTFIPIFGTYTVPQLVGGKGSYMVGNIIVDQVTKVRNWPLASSFSMIITLVSMAGVLLMLGTNKKETKLNKTSNKEDSGVPETKQNTAKEASL